MIDKINQENRDLAEIEKVARFDAKGMFWQWVSVGRWFLSGGFVSLVLHIVLSNLFDDTWFNGTLDSDIQGFINENIIKSGFWIFFLPVIIWFGFIWLRKYWNQISANFLEVNFTEKLIFAGFGFWVGLGFLGFEFDAGRFAIELWGGNSSWVWRPFGILTWDFSNPLNFYFFRDFTKLTWSDAYFGFRLLVFSILFLRLIKALIAFWKGEILKFDKFNKQVVLDDKQIPIAVKIFVFAFFILNLVFFYFFNNYEIRLEIFLSFLFYTSLLALQILHSLSYSPKLFELRYKGTKEGKEDYALSVDWAFLALSASLAFFVGLLGLLGLSDFVFLVVSLLSIFSALSASLTFLVFLVFLAGWTDWAGWALLAVYSILAQIIISNLISKLLKSAKKSSLIPCEEPTQKYVEVKEILGADSQFLKKVDDFVIKKILNYPHQNLQNRSEVYCIDGTWGAGKSSFIGLVKDKVYSDFKKQKAESKKKNLWQKVVGSVDIPEILDLKNRQGKNNIIWVDFNPWNYLTADKLVADFFDTLENRIGKIYGGGLSKSLNKYVKILVSAKPNLFGFGLDFSYNPLAGDQDLNILKDQIQTKLRSIKEKIVIVIDDIDRLPPETVLTVLKLVGITANFPNIFFVLAMDYDKVEKIVQKELGEQYQNYLQKIVNQRVPLPKWSYGELGDMFGYYIKNAVEAFGKLEGLEEFDQWFEFEGGNKQNVKILENYVTQVFIKVLLKKIRELEKNKLIEFNQNSILEFRTNPLRNLGLVEKIIKEGFYNGFKVYDLRDLFKTMFSKKDIFKISDLAEGIIKKSDFENEIQKYEKRDKEEIKQDYYFLKNGSDSEKANIIKKYEVNQIINGEESKKTIDYREKEKILHICEIILIKKELEDYSKIVKNEISITPRDIKQLATKYIYGVAEVYDELFKKSFNKNEGIDSASVSANGNGKASLTPTDFHNEKESFSSTGFQQEFKDKLNEKLPEIVQETVDSQFFGIG